MLLLAASGYIICETGGIGMLEVAQKGSRVITLGGRWSSLVPGWVQACFRYQATVLGL